MHRYTLPFEKTRMEGNFLKNHPNYLKDIRYSPQSSIISKFTFFYLAFEQEHINKRALGINKPTTMVTILDLILIFVTWHRTSKYGRYKNLVLN